MLDDMYVVEESELPPLSDPKMVEYGNEFGREFDAFSKPRASLEWELWPACDRAFMCIRDDLPFIPSMKFVDNGMLGEADIRNAIKKARDTLMSSCLPTDESWLEPVKMNDEDDDGSLEMVKRLMISKFEDADIRDTCQIAFDQLLARGITAVGLRWDTLFTVRDVPREMAKGLRDIAESLDITDEDGKPLIPKKGPVQVWKKIFDGPLTYPIDMYRLWLDPNADLGGKDRDMSFIYMTFKTMSDLKNARDAKTNEPLYDHKVLEDVTEWTFQQYYRQNPWACQSTKFMGVDPSLEDMGKFVPVYLFYRQVREFEDKEVYVNKYFYVARSGNGREWKVIRVQKNPSTFGVKPFYVMNVDPWLNTPYGSSLAEKALSAWKAKNIIEAIALNAKVLQAFPPYYYFGNVMKDDRKPRWMPAAGQEIINRPNVGLEWIKPFPISAENVMVGMQEARYYGEKIVSATGAQSGELLSDPTASMSKEKTATEVRQVTAEGGQSQQVLVDRINSKMLEPMANGMHELMRQHYTEPQKFVAVDESGKPSAQEITPDILDRDRNIKILGRQALANKAHMVENATELLKVIADPQAAQAIANLPVLLQDIVFKVASQLGFPIKPEYKMTPDQIFAKEPAVMLAAIQNGLKNPEIRKQVAMQLLQSPEGQAFIAQLQQQMLQQQKPQAANTGGAAA